MDVIHHPPSVEEVFDWLVSPSQIEMYSTCKRKWAFRYIAGRRTPQHPSAALGTELHGIGENYLKNGTEIDHLTKAGNLFMKGLPFLPGPKTGHCEGNLIFTYEGIQYNGFIDLRGPLPANARFMGIEKAVDRVVLDHKTSSAPKKYGIWEKISKDPNQPGFLQAPQPVLYGAYDIIQSGDAVANLRWLYYWTKGSARAEPSDCQLTRAELEDAFEPVVHNPAKEIVRLKVLSPDPMDVDPSPESCNKYGGCPYRDVCELTNEQKIRGAVKAAEKPKYKKEKQMGALDKIKARQAATNGSATETAPEPEKKEDKINPPESRQETKEAPAPRAESPKKAIANEIKAQAGDRAHAVADVLEAIARLLRA